MKIDLSDRRVLVTGGNSGIGQAIAEEFGAAGARVAVNYVAHPEAATAVVSALRAKTDSGEGRDAFAVEADVSDAASVKAMFARLDERWGGVDVLVNNAGIDGLRMLAWEADLDAWRRVIEVNLVGAFHCAREALKRMVAQRSGVVLNITSVHEIIPWTGYSAYTAAKAGLGMLARTMAQEAAPHGVRVLALAPGAVQTAINKAVWSNARMRRDLLEKIPMNRIGQPGEVARMAVVLASDAASYVTGSTVFVDGAMTDYPDFGHGG